MYDFYAEQIYSEAQLITHHLRALQRRSMDTEALFNGPVIVTIRAMSISL